MDTTRIRSLIAPAAIAAQALFIGGWILAGALEGHGYDPGRHDVSDLGAMTAHHPGLMLLACGLSGALTMAFALIALRPALSAPGLRPPRSAWLVALSLPALDNLADVAFRLDCRAADPGCSAARAAASWHGTAHMAAFAVAALFTLVAPFALSRRMAQVEGWRDLARPTRAFGFVFVAGLVGTAASTGTALQGWSQRVLIVVVCSGMATLARRVQRLAATTPKASGAAGSLTPGVRLSA